MIKKSLKEIIIVFLFFSSLTIIFFKEVIFLRYFIKDPINPTPLYPNILSLLKNNLPLWNPFQLCGSPLLADLDTYTLLSPFILLGLFLQYFFNLTNFATFNFIYILHLPLAGFFMYLYTRKIGIKRIAAIISGAIFAFNNFIMCEYELCTFNTYTWFPFILFLLEKALDREKINWHYIILTGFFYGILWLGGDPQFAYYFSIFFISYILFRFSPRFRRNFFKRQEVKMFILTFSLIFIIGIGIFAIQLFPTYELASYSERLNYDASHDGDFLNKDFLMGMLRFDLEASQLYQDWIIWLLFVISIFYFKRNYLIYFLMIIMFSLTLALGRGWLFDFFVRYVPYFKIFRVPFRIVCIFIFSFAVLAGFGFSVIQDKLRFKKEGFNTILMLIFLCFCLVQIHQSWKKVYRGQYMLEILCKGYPEVYDNDYRKGRGIVEQFLGKKYDWSSLYRIWLHRDYVLNYFSIPSANGRSSFIFSRYFEFTKTSTKAIKLTRESPYNGFLLHPNYLRLTSTEYIVLSKNYDDDEYCENGDIMPQKIIQIFNQNPLFKKIYQDEINQVYLFKDTLPRSFFVTKALYIKDKQKILDTLKEPTFDPGQTVILEEPIDKFNLPLKGKSPQSFVKITKYLPNRVNLTVDAKSCGFLILLDTYYPGWKAYINKKPTKIYRANYLFRALYIDKPGHYSIEFVYSPLSVKLGAAITLLTLIGCIGGLVWRRKRSNI